MTHAELQKKKEEDCTNLAQPKHTHVCHNYVAIDLEYRSNTIALLLLVLKGKSQQKPKKFT